MGGGFLFQASLSLPGSPFNIRRASRGSHQLSHRNGRPRFTGADTKPLVLNTLLDAEVNTHTDPCRHENNWSLGQRNAVVRPRAKQIIITTRLHFQEHLPYADDSNAVTPMSEENGAIVVPVSYANFGSRHSSYTSHTSRITYTSHADLFKPPMTKERQLRSRSARNYFNPSEQRYYRDVRDSVWIQRGAPIKHQKIFILFTVVAGTPREIFRKSLRFVTHYSVCARIIIHASFVVVTL